MPRNDDPSWSRRVALPFESSLQGRALISPYAELDRCAIVSPHGGVKIGASRFTQCVIIEPVTIEDNVVATAAILGSHVGSGGMYGATIERDCEIEAHADVQGHLGRGVIVRRGSFVGREARIGDGAELMDRCYVDTDAEVGDGAKIGVGATVGANAFVHDGAVVPAGANIPPGGYWKGIESRMEEGDRVTFSLVDEPEEPDAQHYIDDEWDEWGDREMVRGRPMLYLPDFNPGSARSWVMAKLARIAVLRGADKPLKKSDVRQYRPELVDHPVTREVLRMRPVPNAEELNEMSLGGLSEAFYDIYTGVRFNAGDTPGWQMLTEDSNDVFVLAVPHRVIQEVVKDVDREHGWDEEHTVDAYDEGPIVKKHRVQMATVEQALFPSVEWHPDRDVNWAIGWVRTILYPRRAIVIVEVQTDRPWMKFNWKDRGADMPEWTQDRWDFQQQYDLTNRVGDRLREMYFDTFASDAINVVIEWAFSQRYQEVLILDRKSRKKLGGKPPKDYYETIPKKYTLAGPEPLPLWISVNEWVEDRGSLRARRVRPNPKLV